jgi:CRISPR/Cas system-associated endonuclease/helicase Cas3
MKKELRDFESARKFARKLGLASYTEWKKYSKSDKKPNDIPSYPDQYYKNKGWVNWGGLSWNWNCISKRHEIQRF